MQADGLILAGGKSRRMGGYHKGDLVYHRQTFLEHMICEFQKEADHILISYGTERRGEYEGCGIVEDEFPDCGPMGGIHAGLKACENDYVMVAACDMPFLGIELYRYLYGKLRKAEEAEGICYAGAVPVAEGRLHPLAAIYKKGLETELEDRLKAGRYRLTEALGGRRILYVDVSKNQDFRKMLMNVNTVAEYDALIKLEVGEERIRTSEMEQRKPKTGQEQKGTVQRETDGEAGTADVQSGPVSPEAARPVIVICGTKNSGKTTLLVRLVKELTRQGIRTAVIKHDGHDFTCDIPGTDSYRFQEAGACGTAVYSQYRTFIHKLGEPDPEELMSQFPAADIIFIEGMKASPYPKLEVVRKGISEQPVSNPEGRFLLVTDWEAGHFEEPAAGFDQLDVIIGKIMENLPQKL